MRIADACGKDFCTLLYMRRIDCNELTMRRIDRSPLGPLVGLRMYIDFTKYDYQTAYQ